MRFDPVTGKVVEEAQTDGSLGVNSLGRSSPTTSGWDYPSIHGGPFVPTVGAESGGEAIQSVEAVISGPGSHTDPQAVKSYKPRHHPGIPGGGDES